MASHYLYRPTYRPLLFQSQLLLTSSRSVSTRPTQRAQKESGHKNPLPSYIRSSAPPPSRPSFPSSSSSSPPSSQSTDPYEGLARITNRLARTTPTARTRTIRDLEHSSRRNALERQQPRRWAQGDVYSPHDLSPVEAMKRKRSAMRGGVAPDRDVFDVLGINPLDEYKNFAMMSEFCGPSGRIKHRRETGLRNVNQRRVAKAIRRAVGLGLLPSVHGHPVILERERREANKRWFGERGFGGLLTKGPGMRMG